jgi:hypothetical protein
MKHEENTSTEDDERVVFGGRERDNASIAKGHNPALCRHVSVV